MKEILVLIEYDKQDLTELTKEILGMGREFAEANNIPLSGVILGGEYNHLADTVASYGVKIVYTGVDQALNHYQNEIYVDTLTNLITKKKPRLILCGMSANGRELGSRLAARLKTMFLTGVMDIKVNKESLLEITRLKWGGQGQERVTIKSDQPIVLGMAAETRGIEKPMMVPPYQKELIDPVLPKKNNIRHLKSYISEPEEIDLTEADVIIAGGNGISKETTFNLLREVGRLIGAPVGGSRVVLDKGWIPHSRMIGATGKIIRPRVYLAFGISGAIQHMIGVKDVKTLIAINKNPQAEIMQSSDLAVISDAHETLSSLVSQLKELDKKGAEEQ